MKNNCFPTPTEILKTNTSKVFNRNFTNNHYNRKYITTNKYRVFPSQF
jgi:hypothetical protein